jgi:glycosyltransferase involved in cell wall biosynthesis
MLFTIITPIYNDIVCLNLLLNRISQIAFDSNENFELIICDDSDREFYISNKNAITEMLLPLEEISNLKLIYQYTAQFDINGIKDYGLARARNIGIALSSGVFLIFLDHRLVPENYGSLKLLIEACNSGNQIWAYGSKGVVSKDVGFVENFSCIKKFDIVRAGMFNERVNIYGGMTLELTLRFSKQGFKFLHVSNSLAKILSASGSREIKSQCIPRARRFIEQLYFGQNSN